LFSVSPQKISTFKVIYNNHTHTNFYNMCIMFNVITKCRREKRKIYCFYFFFTIYFLYFYYFIKIEETTWRKPRRAVKIYIYKKKRIFILWRGRDNRLKCSWRRTKKKRNYKNILFIFNCCNSTFFPFFIY